MPLHVQNGHIKNCFNISQDSRKCFDYCLVFLNSFGGFLNLASSMQLAVVVLVDALGPELVLEFDPVESGTPPKTVFRPGPVWGCDKTHPISQSHVKNDTLDDKKAQEKWDFTLLTLSKEAQVVSITDCQAGNPCELISDPTVKSEYSMIRGIKGQ
ncbi:hypothetical protein Tco_0313415 [Tanacetum coccineum]